MRDFFSKYLLPVGAKNVGKYAEFVDMQSHDSLSELQILFLVPLLLRLELHKALFLDQMTLSS